MVTVIPFLVFLRCNMNAYFENNQDFNSSSRIIEAYFNDSIIHTRSTRRVCDLLGSLLAVILSALTSTKAKCIFKALSVTVCLIGFVGIIGAMEHGTIGLGVGFLIGMLLVGVEFLCLRQRQR